MDKKLSICMIVKDEEKNLKRCLDSLKPVLEKDYTELIIVDTGSQDNTVNIAKEYTDRVYFHQWNGSFSDMRNVSISYAKGDWIFIIDADEELETPDRLIKLLESELLNKYKTVRIREKHLLSVQKKKFVYHVQERLFKNDGSFKYVGSIHNQPMYQHPVLTTDIWLMHYGYINEDKELMEKKFKRTATMLIEELKKDPNNVYYRFQLARSYMMYQDPFSALEEISKAYDIMKKQPKELLPKRYYVFGEYARISLNAKKYQQTIDICQEGLLYKENYLDLYFYMGHAYLCLDEFEKGISALNKYLELHQKYNNEELSLSEFNAIEMYTLDDNTLYGTLDRIISLLFDKKIQELVNEQYYSLLERIDDNNIKYTLFIKLALLESNYAKIYDYYQSLSEEEQYIFANHLERIRSNLDDTECRELEKIFCNDKTSYGLLNNIRLADNKGQLLLQFLHEGHDVLKFRDEEIVEIAKYFIEYGYITRFFKELDNLVIQKITKVLIDKEEKQEFFVEMLRKNFKVNDFQSNRIFISIANVLLLSSVENAENIEETYEKLGDIFEEYLEKGIEYIKFLYNTNRIRFIYRTIENKNEKFFAIMYLAQEAQTKGDQRSYHKYILEAAKEYPYLSKLLKVYIAEQANEIYYKLALKYEEEQEYLSAIELYEQILLEPSISIKKDKIIERIRTIEQHHKNKIQESLETKKKLRQINENLTIPNLHLIIDSPYCKSLMAFINNKFEMNHHLFLIITNDKKGLKYINADEFTNLKILSYDENKQEIAKLITSCQKLFIHFLTDFFCQLIIENNISGKIYWLLWGGDLYNYINFNLFDEYTSEFLNKIGFKHQNYPINVTRRKAIRNVDYVLTWIKEDYELLKSEFTTNAQYKEFIYPQILNLISNKKHQGKSLKYNLKNNYKYVFMLGNSGDPSNNHLDVLYFLKRFEQESFCVIAPLSYGNPIYINYLIKKGKDLLGDKFIPITEFMKEDEYIQLLSQVDVAFMNHNRQQATGNILLLLKLGKKVFMKNSSSIFSTLTNKGIKIFDIGQLNNISFSELVNYGDYIEYINNNSSKITNLFSEEIIRNLMEDIFNS
jgi:glycosyltransferase involved in cell wall biosynthesis